MPRITPGNHLYFYQLFSAEMGLGKQTPLQRVEEVLAEADVLLDDIECDSIDQLLQELTDFLKVTTFKKGRVFVTVLQRDDLDALLEKAEQPPADKEALQAGKSWKRARRSKDVRPTKPRHKRVAKKPQAEPEVVAEVPAVDVAALIDAPAPADAPEVPQEVAVAAAPEPVTAPEAAVVPEAEAVPEAEVAPEPQPEATPEPEAAPEPVASEPEEAQPTAEPLPTEEAAPEPSKIDASESSEPASETQAEEMPADAELNVAAEPEQEPELEPEPVPAPAPIPSAPTEPRNEPAHAIGLPSSISKDVFCPDACLLKIYQAIPHKVGLLEMLDESWSFAQEAGTLEGTRTRVTFPLSRVIEGNMPIEITIARVPRLTSGKRWQIVEVNAD